MTGPDATANPPLHASAVALGPHGLLILGPSGSGKTRLALELVALGAELVADDRVLLAADGQGGLVMRPPPGLAGLVELRGAGILHHPYRAEAPLWLAADLAEAPDGRMPEPFRLSLPGGIAIPVLAAAPPLHAAALLAILRTGALPDPAFAPPTAAPALHAGPAAAAERAHG
ncbi:MAG: serine kinase [Pseudomonadota bacterium]